MPDQSHQFFLNGLGALGRTEDIRPVKGIADLSAETKGFLLHSMPQLYTLLERGHYTVTER